MVQEGTLLDLDEYEPVTLNQIKCCLLAATIEKLTTADLLIPELVYPSACGDAPPCLDKSYMTAFMSPEGIRNPNEFEAGRCAQQNEAVFVVCYGVCLKSPMDSSLASFCNQPTSPGTCADPTPGTYAGESKTLDDILEAMTCAAECFSCGGAESRCTLPVLSGSSQECAGARPSTSVRWRIRW